MIQDTYLKALFIPVLGIMIPLISGIITYSSYNTAGIIGANLFFIITSFIIWKGCNWIHVKVRVFYRPGVNPFLKIVSLCAVSALYGACIGCLMAMLWIKISKEVFSWS